VTLRFRFRAPGGLRKIGIAAITISVQRIVQALWGRRNSPPPGTNRGLGRSARTDCRRKFTTRRALLLQ